MKIGKFILSAAALTVTAAISLAFKITNKYSSGHTLFVQVTNGIGENIACVTCRSVRTKAAGGIPASGCYTAIGGQWVRARNGKTFFTTRTASHVKCLTPFDKSMRSL